MKVGIGPRNTSGQAYALARALRGAGIAAESFAPEQHRPPMGWPIDRRVPTKVWTVTGWEEYIAGFTHLLAWNGIGPRGRWFDVDPDPRVAVMFRGSDLRVPDRHRRAEPHSPFGHDVLSDKLRVRTEAMRIRLSRWEGSVFVATAGLREYDHRAKWCPIIADPVPDRAPLFQRERPRVLHNPTNLTIKGTVDPDPAYELRQPGPVSAADMLRAIADADVVVGGLRLGDYGGTEIQAMAAGRVVVGNVSPKVRAAADVPIIQADPSTVVDVLRDIARNPDAYRDAAAQGPAFHARYHDGRYSVAALSDFLGVEAVAA